MDRQYCQSQIIDPQTKQLRQCRNYRKYPLDYPMYCLLHVKQTTKTKLSQRGG